MIEWLRILVCKLRHKDYDLRQIEYGGGYVRSCRLCKCEFYVKR